MRFVYTNHSTPDNLRAYNGLPIGIIFEVDAPDATAADKLFIAKFGFKFSDPRAVFISMYSPEWPCCVSTGKDR